MTEENKNDDSANGGAAPAPATESVTLIDRNLETTLDNMRTGDIFKIGRNAVMRTFNGGRGGNDKYSMLYAGTADTTNVNSFRDVPSINLADSSLTFTLVNPYDLRYIDKNVVTIKGRYQINGSIEDKKRFLRLHYARAAAIAGAFAGRTKSGVVNSHGNINWCTDDGAIIPVPTAPGGKHLKRDPDMRAKYVVPTRKEMNSGKIKSGAYKCSDYKEWSDYKLFTNVPGNAAATDKLTYDHSLTITGDAPDPKTGVGSPLSQCQIEYDVGLRLVAPKTQNGFISNAEEVSTRMDFYLGHLIPIFTHHAEGNNYTGSAASLFRGSMCLNNVMFRKVADPERGPELILCHLFKEVLGVAHCWPTPRANSDGRGWTPNMLNLTVENAIVNPREDRLTDRETVDGPAQLQNLLTRFPYVQNKKDEIESATDFIVSDAEMADMDMPGENEPPAKKARTVSSAESSPMSTDSPG